MQAHAIARVGRRHRASGIGHTGYQLVAGVARGGDVDQGIFDIAQCAKHGLAPLAIRLFALFAPFAHHGAAPSEIKDRKGQLALSRQHRAFADEEIADPAGGQFGCQRQRKFGIEIGHCNPDGGGGCGQSPFGRAHVRAAADQIDRQAGGHFGGYQRQRPGQFKLGHKRLGRFADECCQCMDHGPGLGVERGDLRARLAGLCVLRERIALGHQADLRGVHHQVGRSRLAVGLCLLQPGLFLISAQLHVIRRNFGTKRHARIAQGPLCGGFLCVCRFDLPAHAAKQVKFPARVEPGRKQRYVAWQRSLGVACIARLPGHLLHKFAKIG